MIRSSIYAWTFAAATCLVGLAAHAAPDAGDPSTVLVRVVEAARQPVTANIVFSGDIQAQAQTNVAFRTNGKVLTRLVEVGEHVEADQVLARLDPQQLQADLDNAKAALTSAEAQAAQAKLTYERQKQLLQGGFTTRPSFDNAEQQLRVTQASVDAAKAALGTAQEQFSYTELRSGVAGIVMSRSFETGQVVQAGQTLLVLAQDGARDAVFNVYEALTANPPPAEIEVTLQANPAIKTSGTVREVSPTVDATSGTVRVKIGLASTPPDMTLGSVVIGRAKYTAREAVVLPWSALFRWQDKPAVWTYDPESGRVDLRNVEIDRYGIDTIQVGAGVEHGEHVVIAGIQFLRPGLAVAVAPTDETKLRSQGMAP